ncbi:CRAL-TRIO domain-containing protein [Mycena pura]|uniref:CRAL-TRIO domain-containing protein n=1 Tax=Mycena pura TaxID=153505 RepID=A0AAD6VKZ8_9AGAR|nr:CRAL-TRIO domain-containing protein [Mycena pura]
MDLLLQTNREKFKQLSLQYTENLEAVLALQGTLIEDILPSVTDELELDDESIWWAKEWLSDTCSLFRILRRNKFTRSFALECIRKTLVWRFSHLWPPEPPLHMPIVHCLPPLATDPFGRPILVIKIVSLNDGSDAYKPLVIRGFECLRLHLKRLNDNSSQSPVPTLQYVLLLDLKNFSAQSLNIDLFAWTLREVVPHFPGLLAAAFVVNYSWAHGGIWSIAKRILPTPALARVFFPTQEELTEYFSVSMLPKDYGGNLASLTELRDPLRNVNGPLFPIQPDVGRPPSPSLSASAPPIVPVPSKARAPSITPIPPISILNPFFGYPVSSSDGLPSLRHGRRRKRDLALTLFILAWQRWRRHILTCVWILGVILAFRGRRALFRSSRAVQSVWKAVYKRSVTSNLPT